MQYTNPILPGFYPDPSICRVENDYYLVTSSFEYFPGVPIFHSRDLVHWRQIGHCLTRTSQLALSNAPSSGGIYAPTLRYHNGTFYMVTTNVSGGGHFYVYTQQPEGEWSDPVWFTADGDQLNFSIDPSLFFDDDGKVYFTCTGPGQRIYQFEIDITTGQALSEIQQIWAGTGGKYPEGPHLYKINGRYYLMVAEGGTEYGHFETIARANNPWGPFEGCPHNPILTHRSTEHPIQATGHADLIQAHNGAWWLVFLAVRPHGYPPVYHLGRETYLTPVQWTSDGWPIVGRVDLVMEADLLPQHAWDNTTTSCRDDFDAPQLEMEWNFRRNPNPASWSLTDRPGWLRLTGSAATLDEMELTAFVGRRQQHFQCSVTVCLDYQPLDGEAGLTVFMNERHHYEIFVKQLDGKRHVVVRRRIGSLVAVVGQEAIGDGVVMLRIQADMEQYRFFYFGESQEPREIAAGETRYLSTEVAGGFTGVYCGMYAQGPTSADFDWFDYEPLD
ncbi:MAG TPA: glycoside hydrolase family 43 protein [Aggregatilineaceae bacterium]|nr:glycoside hydrolase family 43 protein [Aggregatilineaceae bacterium]